MKEEGWKKKLINNQDGGKWYRDAVEKRLVEYGYPEKMNPQKHQAATAVRKVIALRTGISCKPGGGMNEGDANRAIAELELVLPKRARECRCRNHRGRMGAMLRVVYADSELLTLGYVGKVNAVVGEALFDGLFEGTIDYLNGEVRSYAGEGHGIYIREKCHMNGEFAGLVKFKIYDKESDVPELAKITLEHLEKQTVR